MKQYIFVAFLLPSAIQGMVKIDSATKARQETLIHIKQVLTAGKYVYGDHVEIYRDITKRSRGIVDDCHLDSLASDKDESRRKIAGQLEAWSQLLQGLGDLVDKHSKEAGLDKNALQTQLGDSKKSLETWISLLKSGKGANVSHLKSKMIESWDSAETRMREAMSAQGRFERSQDLSAKLPLDSVFKLVCIQLP